MKGENNLSKVIIIMLKMFVIITLTHHLIHYYSLEDSKRTEYKIGLLSAINLKPITHFKTTFLVNCKLFHTHK